ncbi:Synaptonemal complex protein 1 [Varanus komodoensis]|nr:Synaptonemal complex protein 1 [Varanus komodoensis]
MEEMKSSLQMAENTCKCLETELQTAEKTLMQVTEQKEMAVEELKELKETIVQHGSVIDELQSKISNLKELLEKEERRQKELRDESNILVLELQKKSAELEIMAKLKNDKEKQAEEIARALESSMHAQKDLEHQLECAQSEKTLLIKENETRSADSTIQKSSSGELEHQITWRLSTVTGSSLQNVKSTRTTLSHKDGMGAAPCRGTTEYLYLVTNKGRIVFDSLRKPVGGREAEKRPADGAGKTHTSYMGAVLLLLLLLVAKLCLTHHDPMDNTPPGLSVLHHPQSPLKFTPIASVRNLENEISEKEKHLKTLENKINSLKKQIETKTKNIDEIQQEVNKLQLEMENMNKLHKETVDTYKNETETAKTAEKELLKETVMVVLQNVFIAVVANTNECSIVFTVLMMPLPNSLGPGYLKECLLPYMPFCPLRSAAEALFREPSVKDIRRLETMKSIADEAAATQKEIDVRCQHKITEMVALMEKHKHQYDKTVEEKDAELENYKTKEQELTSIIGSLERELSCKKSEISSLQEHLKAEINEKDLDAKGKIVQSFTNLDQIPIE